MRTFLVSEIANELSLQWFGCDTPLEGLNLANRHIMQSNVLSYCTNSRFLEIALNNPKVGAVVISPDLYERCVTIRDRSFLVSNTPEWTFYTIFEYLISKGFFKEAPTLPILNNATIGEGVVIEDNVVLGRNVVIGHNSIIKQGTCIGDNTVVGNGCVIGEDGFQVIYDPDGHPHCITHVGKVRIGNNVKLSDYVTVNKSLFGGETYISDNVLIDTKSHIAHNVFVGKNSVITSFVNMFGSSSVGKDVWVAPNSAIMNRVHIGDGAFVGASSLVLNDVASGAKVFGHPAKER